MSLYLVTDESNPEWNALVKMTAAEADNVNEFGFETDLIDPGAAMSYPEFAAEYLDKD